MDNYNAWLANDLAKERWRESRPVCVVCGDHIQDEHAYNTERGLMCEGCADAYADELAEDFKRDTMEDWKRFTDDFV